MKRETKKKWAISLISLVCVVAIIGLSFGIYAINVNYGTTKITIDTTKRYQTMQGFGASSAWIYQDLGKEEYSYLHDEAMELLYGDSGLKLNTFRYNVGGGGAELGLYGGNSGTTSVFVPENFNGDYSVFANESNYDLSRDSAVLGLFEKALALGNIDEVVLFANSPHYFMTKNGRTHGEVEYDNNLKEECYKAFSDYMIAITNLVVKTYIEPAEKLLGEEIKVVISPVNEPQWKWGGPYASQEGCHYDPEPLAKFYQVFYDTLTEYNTANGTDYIMDIFECGKYQMIFSSANVKEYFNEFEKYDFFDSVTNISAHSYGANTSKTDKNIFKDYMDKNYEDMTISITEFCTLEWNIDPGMDMGLETGKVILRDLALLDAVNWSWWLSISKAGHSGSAGYEDGLVYWQTDHNGNEVLNLYKRYYVMGHFSKYIDDGDVRIDAKYSDTLGFNGVECVAFEKQDGSIVLIVINDSERDHTIEVDGGYSNVQEILTTHDANTNWLQKSYTYNESLTIPAKSIATYIFTK